jgi:murein DD-endopeptidase MepM/ murein hydrolase activator NlpD
MPQTLAKFSAGRRLFLPLCLAQAIFSSACVLVPPISSVSDTVPVPQAALVPQAAVEKPTIAIAEGSSDPAPSPVLVKEPANPNAEVNQGSYHVLRPGQTISSVARLYQVPVSHLLKVNHITQPTKVRAGTKIFIPGASSPVGTQPVVTSDLAWPLRGRITGPFGPRGKRAHCGIDIDGAVGDEIAAAASGTVIQAGTKRKYGKTVVIEHGDGVSTLYAHASRLLVRVGDHIERGDPIAKVGRTGNARGTHLHFEVRRHDEPVDPLPYLEQENMMAASPS